MEKTCPFCGLMGEIDGMMDIWAYSLHMASCHAIKPAQQEAGPRSKRHPKSVEGLGVKGEGEQ